jgi:hypothetical protein
MISAGLLIMEGTYQGPAHGQDLAGLPVIERMFSWASPRGQQRQIPYGVDHVAAQA